MDFFSASLPVVYNKFSLLHHPCSPLLTGAFPKSAITSSTQSKQAPSLDLTPSYGLAQFLSFKELNSPRGIHTVSTLSFPVLTWAHSTETLFSTPSTLPDPPGHLPRPIWHTWSLLSFLSFLCWSPWSDHPLIPGASVLNPFSLSGYIRWLHPVPTLNLVSPAQISLLNSTPISSCSLDTSTLMINRHLHLTPSTWLSHLRFKLSYLSKRQPPSSSWNYPSTPISNSTQQELLLNLLLKSLTLLSLPGPGHYLFLLGLFH